MRGEERRRKGSLSTEVWDISNHLWLTYVCPTVREPKMRPLMESYQYLCAIVSPLGLQCALQISAVPLRYLFRTIAYGGQFCISSFYLAEATAN